jgi:FkbM family methyltransferase
MPKRRWLQAFVPQDNKYLYRFCKSYVDRYQSENNDDMQSNGEFHFLTRALPRCRIVFDVGANVGSWAKQALRINPAIDLHCFEPSRPTYERLLADGFPSNVVCNNFGLSSRAGDGRLLIFADGSGMNSLYQRQGLEATWGIETNNAHEGIRLDTLDGYVKRLALTSRIDLLKIDVEGHELEVLRGMEATLGKRQIGLIQFEYGGCNADSRVLLRDIFDFLGPFDYEMHKIYPSSIRLVDQYDQHLENFQFQNWVAVPREWPKADLAATGDVRQ